MKKGNHGRNFMMKKYPTTFIKFLRSNFIYLVIEKNLGEMSHPNLHAKSSAKKFGGKPEDYIHLHEWMDETKGWFGDSLHRMFRHHSEGIFEMEKRFGPEFKMKGMKNESAAGALFVVGGSAGAGAVCSRAGVASGG